MIDYKKIADSQSFHENEFKIIEVPWMVEKYICQITTDKQTIHETPKDQLTLVGSAEQGFLKLICEDYLPAGKYQAITPCFRDDKEDFLHKKYFIKNELINTLNVDEDELMQMINKSKLFFAQYIRDSSQLKIVKTNDATSLCSYDIELNGIELGSYGIRKYKNISWIYGTACAEPRFSKAISLIER